MSNVDASFKDGVLTVYSKDLLEKAKRNPATKEYVEIKPFIFRVEIPLDGVKGKVVELDKQKQQKTVNAAEKAVEEIEKRLLKKVEDLIDDLQKMVRDDTAGSKKAESEATKRVEVVQKELERELPDIGRAVRKAVEKVVGSLSNSVKSTSSGGFKGLDLVYKFKGKAERYTAEYATLTKHLQQFRKDLKDNLDREETLRGDYIGQLRKYEGLVQDAKAAAKKDNKTFDEKQFYANHRSAADTTRRAGEKYQKHLDDFRKANGEAAKKLEAKGFRNDAPIVKPLQKLGKEMDLLNRELTERGRAVADTAKVVQDDELWDNVARKVYVLEKQNLNTRDLVSECTDLEKELNAGA